MTLHHERIEMALGAMQPAGPRDLRAYLAQPGPDLAKASETEVEEMIDLLLGIDPNTPARLRFSNLLRAWDNAKEAAWAVGTARNTAQRRQRIHERLKSGAELERRVDDLMPSLRQTTKTGTCHKLECAITTGPRMSGICSSGEDGIRPRS